ncbi:hypothetical protein EWB00_000754 [Schistosoma japonicum]|uniref:Uncharacterized protein n=1 Tax=Schistosoma japonicum TaxID=6182 RepID=A0A4Z2DI46_SCHJA|nr:hypothetical protein EWB00_000754 [Schistosoma japonicum]
MDYHFLLSAQINIGRRVDKIKSWTFKQTREGNAKHEYLCRIALYFVLPIKLVDKFSKPLLEVPRIETWESGFRRLYCVDFNSKRAMLAFYVLSKLASEILKESVDILTESGPKTSSNYSLSEGNSGGI